VGGASLKVAGAEPEAIGTMPVAATAAGAVALAAAAKEAGASIPVIYLPERNPLLPAYIGHASFDVCSQQLLQQVFGSARRQIGRGTSKQHLSTEKTWLGLDAPAALTDAAGLSQRATESRVLCCELAKLGLSAAICFGL
jgi:hypothetical protein